MKIAVLTDVHGNAEGLKAVLEDINSEADRIVCAGDLTGYYPFVNEVFDLVRQHNVECILGNHDEATLKNVPVKSAEVFLAQESLKYTRKKIKENNLCFLSELPRQIRIEEDVKILIVHGSPWDINEYVYQDANFDKFSEVYANIIVMGHTHIPMVKKVDGKIIVNAGSCGQPRDGDSRASYIIIDTKDMGIKVRRVKYDIKKVAEETIQAGLYPYLAECLIRGGKK